MLPELRYGWINNLMISLFMFAKPHLFFILFFLVRYDVMRNGYDHLSRPPN